MFRPERRMLSPGHPKHHLTTPPLRERSPTPSLSPGVSSSTPSNRSASHSGFSPQHHGASGFHHEPYLVPIKHLLYRHLLKMPRRISKSSPSVNSAAADAGHDLRPRQVVPFSSFDRHDQITKDQFLEFIHSDKAPLVPDFPQTIRLLKVEADVAGAFLSNVLNPALAILQALIDRRHQHLLKVVTASQHKNVDKDKDASDSMLDEAIVLMSWPIHEGQEDNPPYKKELFVVEQKRPGYIRNADWTDELVEDEWDKLTRAQKLLPQVLLYSDGFKCQDFVLTDYTTSMSLRVDPATVPNGPEPRALVEYLGAERIITGKPRNPDPFGRTPAHDTGSRSSSGSSGQHASPSRRLGKMRISAPQPYQPPASDED
ncbi:uncharacterized protein JCM6883_000870 [Sporobolomyces salmoneus]|uniref:uncharacterized protein n=1 Tax=Sporobolomyces salmoneus TaxID=183962 RepID=UPI003173A1DE